MPENRTFKIERIHKLGTDSPLKAFVDISIDDIVLIKGFRVVEGAKGFFVTMPQDQGKDKKWYDTVRFLSKESKIAATRMILEEYQKV